MTNATASAPRGSVSAGALRIPWWTRGDWNGLFGLGTNVLLNVIVLTGLCLYVVQIPVDTVYGRILPALGIALPLGNILVRLPGPAPGRAGEPDRRDRASVRPQRAAHVHRRVRGHAPGAHPVR